MFAFSLSTGSSRLRWKERDFSIAQNEEARAWVTDRVGHGVVFMTFHYAEALTNALTNTAVDPSN